jgi:hypothetical protein
MPETIQIKPEIRSHEWSGQSERLANALYEACLRRGLEPQHHVTQERGATVHHVTVGADEITFARGLSEAGRMASEQLGAALRGTPKREARCF